MKKIKIVSVFLILTNLFACSTNEPPVTFNEPQPAETSNLSRFPNKLRGNFLSLNDNSLLIISDKLIQRVTTIDNVIHLSELDSNSRLSGDTIFNSRTNSRIVVTRKGDSLYHHGRYIDTLFQIGINNVLRRQNSNYFLSTKHDDESWIIQKINISDNQLLISNISLEMDKENLKMITKLTQDTIPPFKFSATQKQFTNFINSGGFKETERFVNPVQTKKTNTRR
ncbi:MAG: hypothetical protein RL059_34 [Bacteroidota bacterium]|jgi:hypothetical protein